MHIKGRITMSPGSCIFPYKALNSLTWDVCFSLTNSNLSTFGLPGFCWENYTSRLLPYLLGAVLQSSLRLYAGLESSASPPNKTQFLSFRLCIFFSVDTTMYPALLQAPRIQRRWKQQNPWLLGSLHSSRTRRKKQNNPTLHICSMWALAGWLTSFSLTQTQGVGKGWNLKKTGHVQGPHLSIFPNTLFG